MLCRHNLPASNGRYVAYSLPARVVLAVQVFQALARNVRVDGGGGNVGVAEQHLHHAQVGAVVEQVRGKSVAQRVRRGWGAHARLQRIALDEAPEHVARHGRARRAPAAADEKCV